ncbi:MAG: DUF2254 domain-containing protein [Gammaproteobacteria bacterium]
MAEHSAIISKWRWHVLRTVRQVWVRSVSYGALGIVTALAARPLAPLIPAGVGERIGAQAVDQVLDILASSMLAVATFSLSITVAAFAAAASTATPRAARLLEEDPTTQNVLATFVGAFLFALVGIIALHSGLYDEAGRLLLFTATVAVVGLVVAALLRWISHLMSFGRMGDTLERVERATTHAFRARLATPYLGGMPLWETPPDGLTALPAATTGYVQHVDMRALAECTREAGLEVWLTALPGSFVHPTAPLLWYRVETGHDAVAIPAARLRAAFTCAEVRSFEQDPRFGLVVLAEIAARALSPGVNDPGTAIDVLGRLVRILSRWEIPATPAVRYPRIHVPPIRPGEMLEDGFRPIARDGAGVVEVQRRLHKALTALAAHAPAVFAGAAAAASDEALARARQAGLLDAELAGIATLNAQLEGLAAEVVPARGI